MPSKAHETTLTGFLLDIIPDTFLSALTAGNILQTLLVAILFGIALALVGDKAGRILPALDQFSVVVFKLVAILMQPAPIGAFGAMAFTIGKYGIGSLANLAALVATFYVTVAAVRAGRAGLVARLAGFSIFRLIAYLKAELLLVLGTSSSESALPSLIEKMERAGCPKSVVGLVVPTGYSFNLDGTNIYMTLAALFIAQATNIDLCLGEQLLLLGVAMLSLQGRGGRDRRRLHHSGRDAVDRAVGAGRGHGADPRHRPLHERMPQPDQLHRQCGRDRRRRALGRALDREQFDAALAGQLPSVDRLDPAEIAA